jgi:hypothetical protein
MSDNVYAVEGPDEGMNASNHDMTTSSTSSSPPSNTICHVLPCNMDYHGMAPSHVFFKPAMVEPGICASTFRGRGLLGKTNETTAEGAMLLEVNHGKLYVKSNIDEVMEWQHEHNLDVLKFDDESSRFQVAQSWGEVASAVSIWNHENDLAKTLGNGLCGCERSAKHWMCLISHCFVLCIGYIEVA